MNREPAKLQLHGVHHSARPTWKLRETVEFYRDTLGLPLIHCISARGWGPNNHPDFLHFFFDSGAGSTIAFFYYFNTERPAEFTSVEDATFHATHTAWLARDRDELLAWRERLEKLGVPIKYQITHEIVESIYFSDPNGYNLEISIPVRTTTSLDELDAKLSIDAAIHLIEDPLRASQSLPLSIGDVWEKKGSLVRTLVGAD